MQILIINPNSSESMTHSVAKAVGGNCDYNIVFATGPNDSPAEIIDENTAVQSTQSCWRVLNDSGNPLYYGNYQGIVVACFSNHPLVKLIEEQEKAPPVCSLLSPSVYYLGLFGSPPFSIITSSEEWVEPLNISLRELLGPAGIAQWRPTVAAQVNPIGLCGEADHIARIIRDENCERYDSKTIILGCAGYCGIKQRLESLVPVKVKLVEPCKVALEFVVAAARIRAGENCEDEKEIDILS